MQLLNVPHYTHFTVLFLLQDNMTDMQHHTLYMYIYADICSPDIYMFTFSFKVACSLLKLTLCWTLHVQTLEAADLYLQTFNVHLLKNIF